MRYLYQNYVYIDSFYRHNIDDLCCCLVRSYFSFISVLCIFFSHFLSTKSVSVFNVRLGFMFHVLVLCYLLCNRLNSYQVAVFCCPMLSDFIGCICESLSIWCMYFTSFDKWRQNTDFYQDEYWWTTRLNMERQR